MHVLAVLASLALAPHQSTKLNGPLPTEPGTGGGDVDGFVVDDAGLRFAYVADQETVGALEVHAGTLDGAQPPVRVGPALLPGRRVAIEGLSFSHDGRWLVYVADVAAPGRFELYASPADGSGPPRRLNAELPENSRVEPRAGSFAISADSARVVYLADQDQNNRTEIYSVPVDGSQAPVRLNDPLPPHAEVDDFRETFLISPDGTRVLYAADRDVDQTLQLFSVPIDASEAPRSLFAVQPERGLLGEGERGYALTSGGQVVFRADLDVDGVFALYRVPVDGSAAPQRLTDVTGPGRVLDFALTHDGQTIVLRGDLRVSQRFELFRVPLDGSTAAQPLLTGLVSGGGVDAGLDVTPSFRSFALTPDDRSVVYRADARFDGRYELFRVALTGGEAQRLSPELPFDRDVRHFTLAPDGRQVLFLADTHKRSFDELWVVPVDGSLPAQRLSPSLVTGGSVQSDYVVGAGRVAFRADADVDQRFELYSAPLPGLPGGPYEGRRLGRGLHKLHPDLGPDSDVARGFALAAGGQVLFLADLATPGVVELQSVLGAVGVPRRLSGDLTQGPARGDVVQFAYATPGVVYTGSQRAVGFNEVFAVAPESAPAYAVLTRFDAPAAALSLKLTPDRTRALYLADPEVRGRFELFVVPVERGSSPRRLSGPIAPPGGDVLDDYLVDARGEWVVFRGAVEQPDVIELYAAPLDGSQPARTLNPALAPAGDVHAFALDPLGHTVVFAADPQGDGRPRLFRTPLSVPGVPVDLGLNGVAIEGEALRFLPDGSALLCRADVSDSGHLDLYRVGLAHGTPVRLNAPLVAGSVGDGFRATADGQHVIFTAQQDLPGVTRLYSVPADGSLPPVRLSADSSSAAVGAFVLDPAGAQVAYVGFRSGRPGVFRAPVDGQEPPIEIGEPDLSVSDRLDALLVSPDGGDLLFVRTRPDGTRGLYLARLDGTSAARRLLEIGSTPLGPSFTPDGTRFLVGARPTPSAAAELFLGPLDGSRAPEPLNDPLVSGGNLTAYALAPDGSGVLYRADQDTDEVFELYSVLLD